MKNYLACKELNAWSYLLINVYNIEPQYEISNNVYVRPAKAQISLPICAVW